MKEPADIVLRAFWDHLPPEHKQGKKPSERVRVLLAEAVATARGLFPGLTLSEETFAAFVAERLPEDRSFEGAIEGLSLSELCLVCACENGDPVAVARLESDYLSGIRAALLRARIAESIAEEVAQALPGALLAGDPPELSRYSGRGSLHNWLRVVAVRKAVDRVRQSNRETPVSEERLEELAAIPQDPELAYLRDLYRSDFETAFLDAVRRLDRRQRTLLRTHYLDGLTLGALGRLYRVHRVTVARWLRAARKALLDEIRDILQSRLGINTDELDSVIRLMRDEMDGTLRRILSELGPSD